MAEGEVNGYAGGGGSPEGSLTLLPVCLPIRLHPSPMVEARARQRLPGTARTVIECLPDDIAGVVVLGQRLVPADEYMCSSYAIWAMVANYVAAIDGAKGEKFLLPDGLHEMKRLNQPTWFVLPGLLPVEGKIDQDRCTVSLVPGGIQAVVKALAEEIESPDRGILEMGQGLITRLWLPHFIDRAAADEIAASLQEGAEMPTKLPRPLDETAYAAASWPDGIQIVAGAEARASTYRTIRARKSTPPETLRRLRDLGWVVRAPQSSRKRLRIAPGRTVAARKEN